jgi:hypothetical protein
MDTASSANKAVLRGIRRMVDVEISGRCFVMKYPRFIEACAGVRCKSIAKASAMPIKNREC